MEDGQSRLPLSLGTGAGGEDSGLSALISVLIWLATCSAFNSDLTVTVLHRVQ